MTSNRIKIGHQHQADLPIYLSEFGRVICEKEYLRELYVAIHQMVDPQEGELDVSGFRYWNALNIYKEHVAIPWKESLSAECLERLSIETQVFLMLEPVRELFKQAVARKWLRTFKSSKPDDPTRPTQGWHILKPAQQGGGGNRRRPVPYL